MAVEIITVGIINLVAGILILAIKGSLRFIVGGYLLLTGLVMLLPALL
ncbi:MAG: DUF3096 domain-containing protein [Nanobdellota archaeon]